MFGQASRRSNCFYRHIPAGNGEKPSTLFLENRDTRESHSVPDEFPYPFCAFDFPFNERLAGVVNNIMARETTQAGKIAVYTNAMARHLQFQQRSSSGTWRKLSGRPYVAVTADLAFGDVTGTFLDGFIERWLLKDVGKDTTVYCSHYDLPRWFSFRVAPLLAVGIVLNTAGKESDSVKPSKVRHGIAMSILMAVTAWLF